VKSTRGKEVSFETKSTIGVTLTAKKNATVVQGQTVTGFGRFAGFKNSIVYIECDEVAEKKKD